MTKFGKDGKAKRSNFVFRNIQFLQDQRRIKVGAKLENWKISECFEAWKMIKKHQAEPR
jgi:hypothetical protein